MPSETIKATTGEIDISEYKWNQLLRASIFFSVHATFSLLSASFLDMFVAFFFFNLFFECLLLCIHGHALLKTNTKLTHEFKSHNRKE